MFFPEFLYRLTGRDQQVTWLDPVLEQVRTTSAVGNHSNDYVVREGSVFALTHAASMATPGGAQLVTGQTISVLPPGLNALKSVLETLIYAAPRNAQEFLGWQGEILVPPGWTIRGATSYSAGAVANTSDLFVAGILIPLGNIQRV